MNADIEPVITVNAVLLSSAQATTVRVALATFSMDLASEGLGDDVHGAEMAKRYVELAREVLRIMHKERR